MTVTLVVTHGRSTSTLLERRFEEDATIQRVKDQLYPITGTNPNDMALFLIPMGKDSSASAGTPLIPDSATLASFYPENYMVLKVVDKNPSSSVNVGMFDDLSAVEKYTMSEEDYDKLSSKLNLSIGCFL